MLDKAKLQAAQRADVEASQHEGDGTRRYCGIRLRSKKEEARIA